MFACSGKSGSISRPGPSASRGTASASSTKNTACGLPMLTATASPSGACAERDVKRVHGAGQGDLPPVEPRRPHVDAHLPAAGLLRGKPSGAGLQNHAACCALVKQQLGRAAGAVAARRDLAAVLVPEPEIGVRPAVARGLHCHNLVAADAGAPVRDGAHARAIERERRPPRVEHDEVVAEPVHLGEGKPRHGPGYRGGGRMAPPVTGTTVRAHRPPQPNVCFLFDLRLGLPKSSWVAGRDEEP